MTWQVLLSRFWRLGTNIVFLKNFNFKCLCSYNYVLFWDECRCQHVVVLASCTMGVSVGL